MIIWPDQNLDGETSNNFDWNLATKVCFFLPEQWALERVIIHPSWWWYFKEVFLIFALKLGENASQVDLLLMEKVLLIGSLRRLGTTYRVFCILKMCRIPSTVSHYVMCCFFPKICVYFSKQQLRRDIQFRTWWRCCGSHRLVDLLFYLFTCGPCVLFLERVAQVRLGGPWT